MPALPVIDIAGLRGTEADADAVGRQIDDACRQFGFFLVVGHGVDPALRQELDDAARRFFALDHDEKAAIRMERAGRAWRGWFPVGAELTSGVPDVKEGLYFGTELDRLDPRVLEGLPLHGPNQFPDRPAELAELVLAYLDAMQGLGALLLEGVARGLGLAPGWFATHLTQDPTLLFRIFRYPPLPDDPTSWSVGEHTDYGLLTILGQDEHGGLEVRSGGSWIEVPADPDAFVCNLGDILDRLTGGRYRSTPHRVRNTTGHERLSFPFFYDPSWDARVDRLPIVERPAEDDAADRWDHASVHGFTGTYGEYLTEKVGKVFPDLVGEGLRATQQSMP